MVEMLLCPRILVPCLPLFLLTVHVSFAFHITSQLRVLRSGAAVRQSNLFVVTGDLTDSTNQPSSSSPSSASLPSSPSLPLSKTSTNKFDFSKFDYNNHWYPVSWARDLPLNQPTKVTIFDIDYVVARIKNDEVVAMLDQCPHKLAALSEGRMTSSGYFQCAYHGWSFDGKDGSCTEIPQVVNDNGDMMPQQLSSRTCGTAVPAQIVQGMVYLFPGGNLEKALLAPAPPMIPELEQGGWRTSPTVRDFPIDWAILVENILDPDHGLFAHQAVGFDLYTATSTSPQTITEELTDDGNGWTITSSVDATQKLLPLNQKLTGASKSNNNNNNNVPKNAKPQDDTKIGYTTFVAPTFAYSCRRNKQTGATSFLTSFYITPTGTGRSRFMANAVYKAPLALPRWLTNMNTLNFLDQDTYLLATQQPRLLALEAAAVQGMNDEENGDPIAHNSGVRLKNFVYRSPTERLGVRVGAFWDQTLSRVPNRVQFLKNYNLQSSHPQSPRTTVLDREAQHLAICPDSQGFVRNCQFLETSSRVLLTLLLSAKAWVALVARGKAAACINSHVLTPSIVGGTLVVCTLIRTVAQRLRREFYFKYTSEYRDKDLKTIPKYWRDKKRQ